MKRVIYLNISGKSVSSTGVGRVVMQAAALFNCKKAVGIELMENRAKFAKVGLTS
jgi:Histone methylation protein DOT1